MSKTKRKAADDFEGGYALGYEDASVFEAQADHDFCACCYDMGFEDAEFALTVEAADDFEGGYALGYEDASVFEAAEDFEAGYKEGYEDALRYARTLNPLLNQLEKVHPAPQLLTEAEHTERAHKRFGR